MKRKGSVILFVLSLFILNGCGESQNNVFQGYVEGEYVYLASSRPGRLEKLLTERGDKVGSQVLLFALEADSERYVLRQAEQELLAATAQLRDMESGKRPEEVAMAAAQLAQAKAEAVNAFALLRRHERLIRSGGISRQELDDSRAAAKAAEARVAELVSQVEVYNLPGREKQIESQQATVNAAGERVAQARWELKEKQVQSPAAGLIYDTLFRSGEWVPAGSPVVQLLPPSHVKVRFFVPETLLGGLRTGSSVLVTADGRAEAFPAVISYVASNVEYTPPIIYSNETRSKLVFMVEAKPDPETAATLHPGQPVNVSLP